MTSFLRPSGGPRTSSGSIVLPSASVTGRGHRRLRNRGTDSPEVRSRRLATACREIENYENYDYILVNDDLEQAVDVMKAIVLSERARRSGRPLTAEDQENLRMAEKQRLHNMRDRIKPILDSFRKV